jgi:hypothetical protein
MTMPKGWPAPVAKEKELTEVEKKQKEELDKILDYYYEVVKPAANDPNVSEKERKRLTEKYFKMKDDKEAEITARKLGIEDGKVKTLKDLKKNKIFEESTKRGKKLDKQMKKEWDRKVNPFIIIIIRSIISKQRWTSHNNRLFRSRCYTVHRYSLYTKLLCLGLGQCSVPDRCRRIIMGRSRNTR